MPSNVLDLWCWVPKLIFQANTTSFSLPSHKPTKNKNNYSPNDFHHPNLHAKLCRPQPQSGSTQPQRSQEQSKGWLIYSNSLLKKLSTLPENSKLPLETASFSGSGGVFIVAMESLVGLISGALLKKVGRCEASCWAFNADGENPFHTVVLWIDYKGCSFGIIAFWSFSWLAPIHSLENHIEMTEMSFQFYTKLFYFCIKGINFLFCHTKIYLTFNTVKI